MNAESKAAQQALDALNEANEANATAARAYYALECDDNATAEEKAEEARLRDAQQNADAALWLAQRRLSWVLFPLKGWPSFDVYIKYEAARAGRRPNGRVF